MTSRLDELFSPDRLRQNWPMKITPVLEPKQAASHLKIRANYDELQRLVAKRFPDISRLSGRFEALTEAINQTFPPDATTGPADAQQQEAIVVMLEQLETLLWAMDLSLGTVR